MRGVARVAGRVAHKRDRLPGWPPERADRRLLHFPSDDLILAILWLLVAVGLVALLVLVSFELLAPSMRFF